MAPVFRAPEDVCLFHKKEPPLARFATMAEPFVFFSHTGFTMFFGYFGMAFASIAFTHRTDAHSPAGLAVALVCSCISMYSTGVACKAATNIAYM